MFKKQGEGRGEEGNPVETEATEYTFPQQQMQQTLV